MEKLLKFQKKIHVTNWTELLQHFDPKIFTPIFEQVANRDDVYSLNHVLEILKSLHSSPSSSLDAFFQHHIHYIPNYLGNIRLSKLKDENRYAEDENITRKKTIIAILEKVIALSQYKEQDTDWINKTVKIITKSLTRNYVNNILVVIVLNEKGMLAKKYNRYAFRIYQTEQL